MLDPLTEREIAVIARCDPRSVRAYICGKLRRPLTVARVEEALGALGLRHLLAAPRWGNRR